MSRGSASLRARSSPHVKDAHPDVIEEMRGEGLMIGVKTRIPPGDFAALARDEKLLTIPAGDNRVRLLPPLTVTDEELSEGVRRLEAAAPRPPKRARGGRARRRQVTGN